MTALEPAVAPHPGDADAAAAFAQLADELLNAMTSIRRSGRAAAGRPAELAALTMAQIDLVRLVRRRPGVSVGEAADALRLAANTVSTLVRQLTEAGLLIRTPDQSDRRVARLELTGEMQDKVGAFRDRRVALLAHTMAGLAPRDRRRVEGAVEVLAQLAARLPDRSAADG
jgi:DNA-binding MarR family transcriptional regulator